MTPCGRREPCHEWGLRTAQWRGIAVDEMRIGCPCVSEREAVAPWSEHARRIRGASASGVQRELLRLENIHLDQGVDGDGIPRVLVSVQRTSRQDNTLAWVHHRADENASIRVVTDMPPPASRSSMTTTRRQGAAFEVADRYAIFPWKRRQDLAIQVMSSLLDLASETGRFEEIFADDVCNLLMESVHVVVSDLVPSRGKIMGHPLSIQTQ